MASIDWLKDRLNNLQKYTKELAEIEPNVMYEKGAWTALKHIFLLSYIRNVYVPIISNHFERFYYLDFCAGSGLNRIQDDVILGSPIIAALAHEKPFTKMFLFEKDEGNAEVLEKRMQRLKEFPEFSDIKYEVICGDCNETINCAFDEMKIYGSYVGSHRLIFFDPEGLEIDYATIKKSLSAYTDMIFNFQTVGVYREVARTVRYPPKDKSRLEKMFGPYESWKNCGSRNEILNAFESMIKTIYSNTIDPGKPITRNVKIDSGDRYLYHLVFLTKQTASGNPWLGAVDRLIEQTEQNTGKVVGKAMDILQGRTTYLEMFMTDEEREQIKK